MCECACMCANVCMRVIFQLSRHCPKFEIPFRECIPFKTQPLMDESLEIFLYLFSRVSGSKSHKSLDGSSQRISNQPGEWLRVASRASGHGAYTGHSAALSSGAPSFPCLHPTLTPPVRPQHAPCSGGITVRQEPHAPISPVRLPE